MSTIDRPRKASGTPEGGQFTATARVPPSSGLAEVRPHHELLTAARAAGWIGSPTGGRGGGLEDARHVLWWSIRFRTDAGSRDEGEVREQLSAVQESLRHSPHGDEHAEAMIHTLRWVLGEEEHPLLPSARALQS